ncbi:hypothetical protein GQ457_08G037010 [Hibiscus cannabinus]
MPLGGRGFLFSRVSPCKEDFRTKNYTIITSKCKGPVYPKKACCAAFLEFACPMADLINDMRNDCAILIAEMGHMILTVLSNIESMWECPNGTQFKNKANHMPCDNRIIILIIILEIKLKG